MFDISDIGFCVATKTTVDICLFMTLAFVLPLKLLRLYVYGTDFCVPTDTAVVRSVYDTGFCVAIETVVISEAYL